MPLPEEPPLPALVPLLLALLAEPLPDEPPLPDEKPLPDEPPPLGLLPLLAEPALLLSAPLALPLWLPPPSVLAVVVLVPVRLSPEFEAETDDTGGGGVCAVCNCVGC